MRVVYTLPDDGACTHYRVSLPLSTARKKLALDCLPVSKANEIGYVADRVSGANLVVASRVSEDVFMKVIDAYHRDGKKIIMDWDDDIFHINPMSDFYGELGTENITVEVGGQTLEVWKDGKNIDIARNKRTLDNVKRICEAVDAVTVTTERLSHIYRQFNDRVIVLPNCVDTNVWQRLDIRKKNRGEVRMGWFGGSSHYEDWVMVSAVLPEVMAKYPHLRLVIMGTKFQGTLKALPQDRIEFHEWVHTQAYPYKAAILDLDFALIPLTDNVFNSGKSTIKWVEMGALGVPAVTSAVAPYDEVMDLCPDNGIFIDNNDMDAWDRGISLMVENAELRALMGAQARRTVLEHFDINSQYPLWVNAYKEVMSWQSRQTPILTPL